MNTATETELVGLLQAVEKIADNAATKRRTKKVAAITPKDELATRIKKAMVTKGITQRQLCVMFGISLPILNHKINGKLTFTLPEAFFLSGILKQFCQIWVQ